jgi:hypothetical protein
MDTDHKHTLEAGMKDCLYVNKKKCCNSAKLLGYISYT